MLNRHRLSLDKLIIFFGSLFLFTWGLSSQEVTGFDSRFYLFVQEMQREGMSWFPMTYHQPYPDYPSASTIVIYFFSILAGQLNKFIAILPSALLAALTMVLTYSIGVFHQRRLGWCAVFFLLLTSVFLKSARSISLDMYPTMICTACFYVIYSADQKKEFARRKWIYPLFILGFIFRGPIGLVMPAGVVCSYYFLNKNIKQLFLSGFLALFLLCISTVLLLLLAKQVGGDTFLRTVLNMEILGRMDNPSWPIYFYFTDSIASYALAYPVVCLILPGIFYYFYQTRALTVEMKLMILLLGWMLVIMLGMSIPDDKKVRYILPAVPAMALMAAYPFAAPISQHYFIMLRKVMTGLLQVFPILFCIAALYLYRYDMTHAFDLKIHYAMAFGGLLLLQGIMLVLRRQQTSWRDAAILGVAALSFCVAYLFFIEPVQLHFDQSRDFVVTVEAKRATDKAHLVFYRENPDGTPIKYLINMPQATQPEFIATESALLDYPAAAYFVASQSYYEALPDSIRAKFNVITKNHLGHVSVVVFTNQKKEQENE